MPCPSIPFCCVPCSSDKIGSGANTISRVRVQVRSSPFDFDLQALSYPALCLKLLPPPPSLVTPGSNPVSVPGSFPLEPPTGEEKEHIAAVLRSHVRGWKAKQVRIMSSRGEEKNEGDDNDGGDEDADGSDEDIGHPVQEGDHLTQTAARHESAALAHLSHAFAVWAATPPPGRDAAWRLELARALTVERAGHDSTRRRAGRLMGEVERLRGRVEVLEACQFPREYALRAPDGDIVEEAVAREMVVGAGRGEGEGEGSAGKEGVNGSGLRTVMNMDMEMDIEEEDIAGHHPPSGPGSTARASAPRSHPAPPMDLSRWDFDRVVAKWRRVVANDRMLNGASPELAPLTTAAGTARLPSSQQQQQQQQQSLSQSLSRSQSWSESGSQSQPQPQPLSLSLSQPQAGSRGRGRPRNTGPEPGSKSGLRSAGGPPAKRQRVSASTCGVEETQQ